VTGPAPAKRVVLSCGHQVGVTDQVTSLLAAGECVRCPRCGKLGLPATRDTRRPAERLIDESRRRRFGPGRR
jgi:hypothetical protein